MSAWFFCACSVANSLSMMGILSADIVNPTMINPISVNESNILIVTLPLGESLSLCN